MTKLEIAAWIDHSVAQAWGVGIAGAVALGVVVFLFGLEIIWEQKSFTLHREGAKETCNK